MDTHPKLYTMQYCRFLVILLLSKLFLFQSTFAVNFSFFHDVNSSEDLLLYGDATITSGAISLTGDTTFFIGRALYHAKVPTKFPNLFLSQPPSISSLPS